MVQKIQSGFGPIYLTCDEGRLLITWDDCLCEYKLVDDAAFDEVVAVIEPLGASGDCDGIVRYCSGAFRDFCFDIGGEMRCKMNAVLGDDWHV